MRNSWHTMAVAVLIFTLVMVSCNNGVLSNPTSPPTTPSEWRTATFTSTGGTFDFSEIGMFISVPAGAIAEGEVYVFQMRLHPPDVPLLPSGPVLVRLGTFQLTGQDITFEEQVEVRFGIAEFRSPGIFSRGYKLNEDQYWEPYGNAPILSDGLHASMRIEGPGVYGVFQVVALHVEATVSQQQGPLPLSVGFKAIITGGQPPYQAVWDFGDNTDPSAGMTAAHTYVDPGEYTATVLVSDANQHWVTDWVHLSALNIGGPHDMP